MGPTSGINNPTVPGHTFMPGPSNIHVPRATRGRVTKIPKSLTAPKIREPRPVKVRAPRMPKGTAPRIRASHLKDSIRLRVPRAKVIK